MAKRKFDVSIPENLDPVKRRKMEAAILAGGPVELPNPVSRGAKTKYRADMAQKVRKWGRDGESRAEIAARLGINPRTLAGYEKKHARFRRAMEDAMYLAQAWWEKQGRVGTWSKGFNSQTYALVMTNRFKADWRHRQDNETGGNVTVNIVKFGNIAKVGVEKKSPKDITPSEAEPMQIDVQATAVES